MEVHTNRIGCKDRGAVDITVKSHVGDLGRLLAPTWEMVMGFKNGQIGWAEYTRQYNAILEQNREEIIEVLSSVSNGKYYKDSGITLLCYCTDKDYCHRYLAAKWIVLNVEGWTFGRLL